MGTNDQCKFCIHSSVCAYKRHYEDVVKLYEKAREECGKYPWFKFKIECVQYCKGSIQSSVGPLTIPYLMHKEMGLPISECQKAYDVGMEYLRSQSKVKG